MEKQNVGLKKRSEKMVHDEYQLTMQMAAKFANIIGTNPNRLN